MGDVARLLRDLLATGQFGIVILALIIVIGGAVWAIYLQRQAMSRFDTIINAVNLNVQAANQVREQTQAAQNEQRERWQSQFDLVVNTNEELRKEIDRIRSEQEQQLFNFRSEQRSEQEKFEKDVNEAISLGFNRLKSFLKQHTVQEIIGQVPENFKEDLRKELEKEAQRAFRETSDLFSAHLNQSYRDMTHSIENIKTKSVEDVKEGIERGVIKDTVQDAMLTVTDIAVHRSLSNLLLHEEFTGPLARRVAAEIDNELLRAEIERRRRGY